MLRFILVQAFLLFYFVAHGQWWTELSSFLGSERDDGVAFSINGYGYAGTGREVGFALTNDFFAYNAETDTWTQVASIPSEPRQYCGRFTIADTGYVVCGFGESGYLNELWAYHPASDTWTQKASFPGQPRSSPVAFSLDENAYVGTGRNGDEYFADFWKYDPIDDEWSQINDFPGGRRFEAIGMNIGTFGYAGLGRLQDNSFANDWWQFNPKDGVWTRRTDFPDETRYYAVEFTLGGRGFIAAGQDQNLDYLNQVYEYNSFDDKWKQAAEIPAVPFKGAFAFSIGNAAFVGSGITSADVRLDKMYRLDLPVAVSRLIVYPNPAVDHIFFSWEGESPQRIDIFDGHGRLISSSILANQKSHRQSLASFSLGGYVANFTWPDGKELSKTFIKVR